MHTLVLPVQPPALPLTRIMNIPTLANRHIILDKYAQFILRTIDISALDVIPRPAGKGNLPGEQLKHKNSITLLHKRLSLVSSSQNLAFAV